jgi:hypothetical protein
MAKKMSVSQLQRDKRTAFELALAVLRQPGLSRDMRRVQIPCDILVLIKISAGDEELKKQLSDKHFVSEDDVEAASKLYVQSIMTTAGANDWRMLCLPTGAILEDVKEHKKWLLKWLHPDRNRNTWQSALFLKVNAAFNRLQSTPIENLLSATSVTPVRQLRQKGLRPPGKFKSSGYKKVSFAKLIQQTSKPILAMALTLLMACFAFFSLASKHSVTNDLISKFAFTWPFN